MRLIQRWDLALLAFIVISEEVEGRACLQPLDVNGEVRWGGETGLPAQHLWQGSRATPT